MIQFVISGPLPSSQLLRRRCLLNPDGLLQLSENGECSSSGSDAADRFSLLLHDLRMAGAWKRTNAGRLKRTVEMLRTHIQRPRSGQKIVFLDIGASDGITTVEAVRTLRESFSENVQAYLADINLWLLRYRRGPVVEYRATNGEPIMLRVGRLGVRLAISRRGEPADFNVIREFYLRLRKFRRTMRLERRISLVNPVAQREPGVSVMELNCLCRNESLISRISAIRASNVLNLGYFDPMQLRVAIGHLHAYLREGGCLVISRNVDSGMYREAENGSVWIKEAFRFHRVTDFGCGSEIKMLVDEWTV